jgi:predicted Zn-dependent peptidase
MHQITRLENGLTIASLSMPHMTSVSVGLWIGVGSRFEIRERNGVCHFIEHLLFKGTTRRTARDISQAIEGTGGYLNAFTSEESTCVHARSGHRRLKEVLEVLCDMLLHSRFAPEDVEKEREVIKEEIAMSLDEPQHQVQELLNATLWPDQPLGRSITGTPASLNALHRPELLGWLRENYVSGSTVVVAAGKVSHRELCQFMKPYAVKMQPGRRPTCPAVQERQTRPAISLLTKSSEQTQLAVGLRTCSRHDPQRLPLRLLNTILGENMSSRLFQLVREDRGLVYSIYSIPSFFHDTGDLVISAGLDAEKLPEVMKLILQELKRLRDDLISPQELRMARDYVIGQIDMGSESTENQMNWIGEQLLGYGRCFSPTSVKKRLAQVTPQEIRAAARTFLRLDRLNVALVSPLKSDRAIRRALPLLA